MQHFVHFLYTFSVKVKNDDEMGENCKLEAEIV